MTVQAGLCRTCSETTLLVFQRGGSFVLPTSSPRRLGLLAGISLTKMESPLYSMRLGPWLQMTRALFFSPFHIVITYSFVIVKMYEPRHEKNGFCLSKNRDSEQLCINCAADQRLCFRYYSFSTYIQNFKLLAIFCACTARFVSDLFTAETALFFHDVAQMWQKTTIISSSQIIKI